MSLLLDPLVDDEVEDADAEAAVAEVAVELAAVEVATRVDEVGSLPSIASVLPTLVWAAVEASMAVGNDEEAADELVFCAPIPFAVSRSTSDDVVVVSLLVLAEVELGYIVVKSPPVHPDDVSVVYTVTTRF